MKKMLLISCGLALVAALQAQIIHVPANYPTIQQGINAATPGDTVMVAEGTYYEQINFKGKKPLMVASRFIMDSDTSHISKTIIDGSQLTNPDSASVVYFISGEDTTSILCGFTIKRGKGTYSIDGGYTFRTGGGVFLDVSGAKIIYNHITENHLNDTLPGSAQCVYSAGLDLGWKMEDHWVVIDHNVIDHNSCYSQGEQSGGAGFFVTYNSRITNNTISNNTSTGKGTASVLGGGFACASDGTVISIFQHNIIKSNLAESQNNFAGGAGGTFQYVTVIFSDNEVSGNQAFCGTTSEGTSGVLFYAPKDGSIARNNTFRENSGSTYGGLYMETYSNFNTNKILVENNYFFDNVSLKNGGAFATHDVPVIMRNNVFSGNCANNGGALYFSKNNNNSSVHLATLINNSFYGNNANYGGAVYSLNAKPLIINSVFWGDRANHSREIYSNGPVEISYSTFNPAFITGTVIDGGGNLNQDPMFADTLLLTLSESSNCFNKGTINFTCGCGVTHNCPPFDITGASRPLGTTVDMGAYEYDINVGIRDWGYPLSDMGIETYPNPFLESTTFMYKLKESSMINLRVFDNIGRLVAEPVNEFQLKGEQKMMWNSGGMPAGIYYCRLQVGDQSRSVKIVKMK